MKKLLAMLLCAMMMLSLVACGGSGGNSNSGNQHQNNGDQQNNTQNDQQQSENGNSDKQDNEQSGNQGEAAYEITYQNARVWTDSIGAKWVQSIVEITNTGSTNLYLESGAYDLEDSTGALVASQSMVSTYPNVLAPGEKGYMYEETTLENYTGDGNLTISPRPDVKEATVDLIRYDVTDISLSSDDFGGVKVLGRVENKTEETESMVYIVAFFYDAAGTPIGSASTILSEDLEAGAKIGFEISGFSMPDDVTPDVIANTTVYAYPLQYQF